MAGLHKILPYDGEFDMLNRPPGNSRVPRVVTLHQVKGQSANVAPSQAEFQIPG